MACLETYATLRIFSASQPPDKVGRILGLQGTVSKPRNPNSRYRHERERHYWAWSTAGVDQTTDGLSHIGTLIDALRGKESCLQKLREMDCEIDVCCYWVSSGQGGPFLDGSSLSALAQLGLDIWWDVYFGDPSEYGDAAKETAASVGAKL